MGETPGVTVYEAMAAVVIPSFGSWILFYNVGPEWLGHTIFVLGWFVVLPLIYVFDTSLPLIEPADTNSETDTPDPIEELRAQYSQGLIDDDEFQHRLDHLLETESLEAKFDRFPRDWEPQQRETGDGRQGEREQATSE